MANLAKLRATNFQLRSYERLSFLFTLRSSVIKFSKALFRHQGSKLTLTWLQIFLYLDKLTINGNLEFQI